MTSTSRLQLCGHVQLIQCVQDHKIPHCMSHCSFESRQNQHNTVSSAAAASVSVLQPDQCMHANVSAVFLIGITVPAGGETAECDQQAEG